MEEQMIFEKRWQLAPIQQRTRYRQLLSHFPKIEWTTREKSALLWLCQLDIDTFETIEEILKKSNKARAKNHQLVEIIGKE
ncbi:hypothetical protein IGI96_002999 [Enterococcus sp. DIV0421]|uniref:hypothetical protein n=1 Tax=Enterococcus sp. DIV0421 TaxID=2774688 RepID=UPI003F201342